MPKRSLVILSTIAFIQIYFVLYFPDLFGYILLSDMVLSAFVLIISAKTRDFFTAIVLCICLIVPSLSAYCSYKRNEIPARDFTEEYASEGTRFEATVDEFRSYGSYAQIFLTLTKADGDELPKAYKARLGTYSGAKLTKGDKLVFIGTPVFVSKVENNGFNTKDYLKSKNVFIDFPSAEIVSSSDTEKKGILQSFREYTENIIYRYIPQNNDYGTAAFCYAVFAGDKNLLPEEMNVLFSRCGLTHILCVSGMHLAIIAGIFFSLMSAFTLHKRTRCILTIVLCFVYTAFTGFSLSTVRACIMCSVTYLGMMSGRKTEVYRSLFLSLLIISVLSPYSVLDISLQLSFCATLGIACFAELIPVTDGFSFIKRVLYAAASMLLSNIGAVMFTLPVSAANFSGISIVSALSTLAVSFIFEALLTSILILVLISPLSFFTILAPATGLMGIICHTLSLAIIKIADFFSSFRYALITPQLSGIYVLLFIVLLCALSLFIGFDKRKAIIVCVALISVLGITFSALSLIVSIYDDSLYRLTYYRKNENNRQLSVKLGTDGYLIMNADSSICTDSGSFMFDERYGKNFLLIIPDKAIDVLALSKDIRLFDERFGIEGIFVTSSWDGDALATELLLHGIHSTALPVNFSVNGIEMSYSCENGFIFRIDDGLISSAVVFSDTYCPEPLDGYDIAAFFTRKTKNQFSIGKDTLPQCRTFFTRLKKDEKAEGIINTNGEKFVTIKG